MEFAPEIKSRKPVMKDESFTDFSGGWNTAATDPGVEMNYCRRSENMMLHADNSYGIRWGTEYIGDSARQEATTGVTLAGAFSTLNGTAVVTVTLANHGLLSGHLITFSGCTDLGGILAADFNTEHDITYIDANTFSIVTANAATATATGMAAANYTHDNKTVTSRTIAARAFQGRAVCVAEDGTIYEQNKETGVTRVIFDNLIAGKQVGAPTGWSSSLRFASFTTFNGQLLIFNGVDKPLLVDFSQPTPCTYLQDLGSGSNFNTPITRYGIGANRYVALFGDVDFPDRVYISNVDTSGTYVGDLAPNDAVNVDLGKIVQTETNTIRGGGRFRDKLIIVFDDVTSLGVLGTYNSGGDHTPDFTDALDQYGGIAHASMQSLGDDFLMADGVGVPSLSRTAISNTIKPERVSDPVSTEIQEAFAALSAETIEDRVFSVYNRLEGQYMLFIPNADALADTTETICYVLTYNRKAGVRAWHRFRGWNFRCGFHDEFDQLFFFNGTKMYQYGSKSYQITADFVGDPAIGNEGTEITFDWELPWTDLGSRMRYKQCKYLRIGSYGTAQFNAEFYCDHQLTDEDGNDTPQLTLPLVGGGTSGFGGGQQPYGGGRRTNDPRPWAFGIKFILGKLRIKGSTKLPLRFFSIAYYYHVGSMRA